MPIQMLRCIEGNRLIL